MQRCTSWFAALALGTLGPAQDAATALSIDTDAAAFAAFLNAGRARLLALQRADGAVVATTAAASASLDDQTGAVLAMLRLGHWQAAKAVLEFEFASIAGRGAVTAVLALEEPGPVGPPRPCDWQQLSVQAGRSAAMLVLQHYWYLRATRDTALIRRHWPLLAACVQRAAPADDFVAAALQLQAVFCLGGLQDQIDRIEQPGRWQAGPPQPRPGAGFTARALQQLQQFEQQYWSEADGRFGTMREGVAALVPAWSGMLTTTGDKTTQHAHAVLATLSLGDERSAAATAVLVSALTQFDGDERAPALAELLRCDVADMSIADLGIALDAALFAVTGLRCAAAPAVDEDWLRLRPELPPGGHRLALRQLTHGGFRGDLFVDEHHGRLHCVVDPHTLATGELLAVVHCRGEQLQTRLSAGTVFEHTAAAAPPLRSLLAPPRFRLVAGSDLLMLARGDRAAKRFADPRTTWIDSTRGPRIGELRQLLLRAAGPAVPRLGLDCGYDADLDAVQCAGQQALFDEYVLAGGQLLRPQWPHLAQQQLADHWLPLRGGADGAMTPDVAAAAVRMVVELAEPHAATLLLGCGCGYRVVVDGSQRCQRRRGPLQQDRDALPLQLQAGRHDIELQFTDGGSSPVYLRWVDARGLPWQP